MNIIIPRPVSSWGGGVYINGIKENVDIKDGESVLELVQRCPSISDIKTKSIISDLNAHRTSYILEQINGLKTEVYKSPTIPEYEYYPNFIGKDHILDYANKLLLKKYPDSDGLLLYVIGAAYSNENPYMVFFDKAWIFTINGIYPTSNEENVSYYNYFKIDHYADTALLQPTDILSLNYTFNITIIQYDEIN